MKSDETTDLTPDDVRRKPAKGLASDMQSKPLPTNRINSAVLAAVVFLVGIVLIIVLYVLI